MSTPYVGASCPCASPWLYLPTSVSLMSDHPVFVPLDIATRPSLSTHISVSLDVHRLDFSFSSLDAAAHWRAQVSIQDISKKDKEKAFEEARCSTQTADAVPAGRGTGVEQRGLRHTSFMQSSGAELERGRIGGLRMLLLRMIVLRAQSIDTAAFVW